VQRAQGAVELLVCSEPSLAILEIAVSVAFREYWEKATHPPEHYSRAADQRLWLDRRGGDAARSARIAAILKQATH
jgi:uncharacterized protein